MNKELIINNNKNTLSICIKGLHQIIINISRDGSYEILSQWSEDDMISFDNILIKLSTYVNPVIKLINKLETKVFSMGGILSPLTNLNFNMLTVSIYYPITFTLFEFNELKNEFKKYEDIGIIRSQNFQISRSFLFSFIKGITDSNFVYDSYNWLYINNNETGRHIRILHRTDRLQIELINIKNIMEYDIIKRYIFSIINDYVKINKIIKIKKIDDSKIKSIRKLHDLDPELYNLHKYSDKIQAYSVLCQSGRQPSIYNEELLKSLSKEKRDKAIKYWNFTTNKPTYYLCNNKYPYINFITDKHPKGYCLPCCKKLKDTPGTKVAEINQTCLQNKLFQTEKDYMSTYILNYGKTLSLGRLCNLPNELSKNMFEKLKTDDDNMNYYIYGVNQFNNTNDTNIGFISSLKFILGNDCIMELANLVKNMKHYYVLANGKASIYNSVNELYMEIINNFVHNSNSLLMNLNMEIWTHILTDLVRYKYNIEIINILNINDEYHLKAYQDAYKSINNNIDVIILMIDENGINPIIYLNHKDFIKNNIFIGILGSQLCKHFFVKSNKKTMDLSFILSFTKKYNYDVVKLYINMKNLCYNVAIKINNNIIYLPILASNIPYKNTTELDYDIIPESNILKEIIVSLINDINNYSNDSIVISNNIIFDNKSIGLLSKDKLCYYHLPNDEINTSYENIIFSYNPRDIDINILQKIKINNLSDGALLKKYYNNIYKLFLSEFITILQKNRNIQMRKQIINILKLTNFMDSKSIESMIFSLNELLKYYPYDLISINNFIEFCYFNSIDINEITKFINLTRFEFDFTILEELRILDTDELIRKLHVIMDDYIIIDDITNIPQYYNIYTSCVDNNEQFFCKKNKIIIPKNKIHDLFYVLANDIKNKSKMYLFLIGNSGLFNYFEFIERPHEFIEISDVKNVL